MAATARAGAKRLRGAASVGSTSHVTRRVSVRATGAVDKERFVNARAEDYWTLQSGTSKGEIDIDPDDDKLAAQLGSINWGIDS
jgi:hypothetical protein